MTLASITLTGTVTKKAEQRYTPSNVSIVSFTMSVARFDNKSKETKAYPVKVNVWGDAGSPFLDILNEGIRVQVSGRLQLNQFTDRNGKNIRVAEVEATTVLPLADLAENIDASPIAEQAGGETFAASAPPSGEAANAPSEEIPF